MWNNRTALAALLTAGLACAAGAAQAPDLATLNPQALRYTLPENIPWVASTTLPGVDSATLVGDPAKPGFYVILNRFHPGSFTRPHYHDNDRHIMVVSGTWWVATGPTFAPESTVPMKPGSFVVHTGREVHYDGARAGGENAVVMIFGNGPGTRHDCMGPAAETGPGPCEQARRAGK